MELFCVADSTDGRRWKFGEWYDTMMACFVLLFGSKAYSFYSLRGKAIYMRKRVIDKFVKKFSGFIFAAALLLSILTGCDNSNDLIDVKENVTPSTEIVPFEGLNIDDDLVGVWQYALTHLDIFLIFNADGTGSERQGYRQVQMFSWTRGDGHLTLEGEFSGNYSYSVTDSSDGRRLYLTVLESGNTLPPFHCVYTTSYTRCCCVRIAQNYFFGMQSSGYTE